MIQEGRETHNSFEGNDLLKMVGQSTKSKRKFLLTFLVIKRVKTMGRLVHPLLFLPALTPTGVNNLWCCEGL